MYFCAIAFRALTLSTSFNNLVNSLQIFPGFKDLLVEIILCSAFFLASDIYNYKFIAKMSTLSKFGSLFLN